MSTAVLSRPTLYRPGSVTSLKNQAYPRELKDINTKRGILTAYLTSYYETTG